MLPSQIISTFLVRVTTAAMKFYDQKQFADEGVYLAYTSSVHPQRKLGQKLKQGSNLETGAVE